jgi:hypothetical protein
VAVVATCRARISSRTGVVSQNEAIDRNNGEEDALAGRGDDNGDEQRDDSLKDFVNCVSFSRCDFATVSEKVN